MADRLWGANSTIDLVAITQRQVHFALYLNDRGIPTSAITGRWCEKFPEICFAQYTPPKSSLDQCDNIGVHSEIA